MRFNLSERSSRPETQTTVAWQAAEKVDNRQVVTANPTNHVVVASPHCCVGYSGGLGREPSLLLEDENVFVLEDVEPAGERPVPPELLLISLCPRLFKVLHDDAL